MNFKTILPYDWSLDKLCCLWCRCQFNHTARFFSLMSLNSTVLPFALSLTVWHRTLINHRTEWFFCFGIFCINRIKTYTGVYKKCRACISCKSPCTDLSMVIGLQVDDISCFARQCQPLQPARGYHLLYRLHGNWKTAKQLPASYAKQLLYRQFWKEDLSV